jgi:hypothetical protein
MTKLDIQRGEAVAKVSKEQTLLKRIMSAKQTF